MTNQTADIVEDQLDDSDLEAAESIESPGINVGEVHRALLGTWPEERQRSRDIVADPTFWRDDTLPYTEHRERVLEQVKELSRRGTTGLAFPKRLGGGENPGGNIAAFEEIFLADPSLQIKSGVHFGLFGAAILHLGTEPHHDKWLPGVMDVSNPGAFAMTETGHGSDVASVATTATYEPETEEFVINTPFRAAWKDYLGNAACHAKAAVVFAQLITKGVNHGVHALYLDIRDDEGNFLPGIGGDDDGVKGGLNGIDNGRLHFANVRVPRENLLNRYGDVAADGTYSSPIESPGRRFFVMLGTLVQGRVSLDGAAAVAQQAALAIAITYGNQRRQFDNSGEGAETVLLDYGRHQRRLIPRIATAYAATFAHDEFLREFDAVFSGKGDTPERRADLETLAAALKPTTTWQGMDTLQEAREACGGAGYLAENRLTFLRHDLDVYTTFEGDNNVLLQLVGKRLLEDYAKKYKDADARETARLFVSQAANKAIHEIGLARIGSIARDLGSSARSVGWLREPENQHALLSARVEEEISEIAMSLNRAQKAGKGAGAFNALQNKLIETAHAYGELIQWEAFTRKLEEFDPNSETHRILTWLRDLHGLTLIERDLAWYLMSGRLTTRRARLVSSYVSRLITRLRPHAQSLVDAFGYKDEHLRAKIASGAEQQRQDEAAAYYVELRASGNAPVDERTLYRAKKKRTR
ncbi:acyl-CoA dehydrogenase family protein [Gulosibacter molinativorax]|uniref:acyl-CoA dehydrogenase family protein n=1 Tax=Gulosibacter molinativorax TaxID=256821 RepID=UPI000401B08F|nr:Putative acyl-CoA dehydrogenase [Gulosibacter molinativorax]